MGRSVARWVLVVLGLALAAPAGAVGTGSIEGRVVDERGEPLVDVAVWLTSTARTATTSDDGSFEFADVDAVQHVLRVGPLDGYSSGLFDGGCLNYWCHSVGVEVADGETADVTVVLRENATVDGRIVADDTGRPIEGVCLVIWGTLIDVCEARSDADGRFSLGLPAEVEVSWGTLGGLPVDYDNVSNPMGGPRTYRPGETVDVDIRLPRLPSVSGVVVDRFGRPVPSRITPGGKETGDDGRFFLRGLQPRRHSISARPLPPDYLAGGVSVDLTDATDLSDVPIVLDIGRRGRSTTDIDGRGATAEMPVVANTGHSRDVATEVGLSLVPDGWVPLPALVYVSENGSETQDWRDLDILLDTSLLPADLELSKMRAWLDERTDPNTFLFPVTIRYVNATLTGGDLVVSFDTPIRTSRFGAISQNGDITLALPIEHFADGWDWVATMYPARGPGGEVWHTQVDLRSAALGGDFSFTVDQPWFQPSITSGSGPALFDALVDTSGLGIGEHVVTLTVTDGLGHVTETEILVVIDS